MDETNELGSAPGLFGDAPKHVPILTKHNPLYFASALCILVGVYLAARDLEDSPGGRIAFAGILELYAGLLIAGASWLLRIGRTRSAVTLALLATFFFVDPTLRVEGMVTTDDFAPPLLVTWLVLALLKPWLIERAFAIRLGSQMRTAAFATAAATASVPWMVRMLPSCHAGVSLASAWIGAALIAYAWARAREHTEHASSARATEGATAQVMVAVAWVLAGGFHYHLYITMHAYEVPLGMKHAVPYLALLPMFARAPARAACAGLLVVAVAAFAPSALSSMALAVSAVLGARGVRARSWPMQATAVLSACVGVWAWGAERYPLSTRWSPHTRWDWAMFVMVLGFVALAVGIAIDFGRARREAA